MHATIKSLVTASLVLSTLTSFAAAGPLADFQRRQDADTSSSISSTEGTLSAVVPTSDPVQTSATATETFSDISFTFSEPTSTDSGAPATSTATGTISITESESAIPTDSGPNTSFTPFTGTFASAPPIVTEVGSFVSENPEDRTRTFTHPHSARPPHPTGYSGEGQDCDCDTVECALVTLTITTRIPIPTPTGGYGHGHGGVSSTVWDESAYPTSGEASSTWMSMSSGAVPTETWNSTMTDITSSAEPTFTDTMTGSGGESTMVLSSDSLPTSTAVDSSGGVDPTVSMPTPVSTPVDASGETDPTATSSDTATETSGLLFDILL